VIWSSLCDFFVVGKFGKNALVRQPGKDSRVRQLFFNFEVRQPSGHYYLQRAVTPDSASFKIKKSASNDYYYLQRAVTPDWMGSIAL
jgi:hypothetical protein